MVNTARLVKGHVDKGNAGNKGNTHRDAGNRVNDVNTRVKGSKCMVIRPNTWMRITHVGYVP